ncbi:MAG: Ldh family oxidoreductase [Kiloniellales bacterium]
MARYPGTHTEKRVAAESLKRLVGDIFEACGMAPEDAARLADTLVTADLRGIHSHGVMRVPSYVDKLVKEGVDPRGRPAVVCERGSALVIDGNNAMGQIGVCFAMRQAIARAREASVALAAVKNSNHCGAMDYYTLMAVREDMIGIAMTNALPTMAPIGGVERIVGLNPLSIAIPAGDEPPLVLDTSFGATARGKVQIYAQMGERIPDGWALDSAGRPTTDPAAALGGLIQPIGGHKGIGLAIMSGLLSTVLTDAAYGTRLGSLEAGPVPGKDGQTVIAIDVAAFDDVAAVKARTDAAIRQIRTSARAEGVDEVLTPGLMEHELAAEFERDGIPLNDLTLEGLRRCAAALQVPMRQALA